MIKLFVEFQNTYNCLDASQKQRKTISCKFKLYYQDHVRFWKLQILKESQYLQLIYITETYHSTSYTL